MSVVSHIMLEVVVVTLSILACSASPPSIDSKDLSTLIQNLRAQVDELTTEKFIKENFFLENWLRLKDFDVQVTFEALAEYIEWRANENITTILDEDWSDMRARFPYNFDTFDKLGRPVLYIDIGQWDFSSYLNEGDAAYDRLARYIFMHHEAVLTKIRELRATDETITRWVVVVNMADFSTFKMACVKCLQFDRYITDIGVKFGTHSLARSVFVNVPYYFKLVYYFLSAEARTYFELYGQDRSQWEPTILDIMERTQLPAGIFVELPQKDNLEGLMVWDKEL